MADLLGNLEVGSASVVGPFGLAEPCGGSSEVGRRLADRRPGATELRGLAVDGKSLRGAARARGRKIHLLAALEHANPVPAFILLSTFGSRHGPMSIFGGGWTKTSTDPGICAAIVDRWTFGGNIIETGTDSYRPTATRPRTEAAAAS